MIRTLLFILMTQLSPMAFADFESDLAATAKTDPSLRELRTRAAQNVADAQFDLGMLYFKGLQVEQDYAESAKWMQRAADQGHVQAAYNLGVMYDAGQGVTIDHAHAAKWYQKSAEQGFALAQLNLGVAYASGEGVPKNEVEAVKWFRLAADQSDAQAQFNLGVMYANGQGTAQNLIESYRLAKLAAAQGNETANLLIGDLTRKMTAKQIARANKPLTKKVATTAPEKPQPLSNQSAIPQPDNKPNTAPEVTQVQPAAETTQPTQHATQTAATPQNETKSAAVAATPTMQTAAAQPATEEAVKAIAPVAAPSSGQPEKTSNYYVQIGAFKSPKQAHEFMEKTRAKQGELDKPYSLFSNEGWERVHVGPYASQIEAQQSADALKVKLGYQPKVRKHE